MPFPYVQRYAPEHPKASASGCVYGHILVAESALGHYLPDGAEVHHVDGDGRNNANSNLVVCESKEYHKLLHVRARIVAAGGDPNTQRFCGGCRRVKAISEFNKEKRHKSTGLQRRCRECQRGRSR